MYSGTRVSGGPFPHASWAMGPDLWLTPSTCMIKNEFLISAKTYFCVFW